MSKPSELQNGLDLAICEMMLARRNAELAQRKLDKTLRTIKKKYPKMGKGIARIERSLEGMPAVLAHLSNAETLLPVLRKLAELEGREVGEETAEFMRVVAPGSSAQPVVPGVTDAPTALGDTDR